MRAEREVVRVRVGCEFRFNAEIPIPAVVLLRAAPEGGVIVETERWHGQPNGSFSDVVDLYGNRARRVVIAPGQSSLRYDAEVTMPGAPEEANPEAVQHRVEDVPGEAIIYLLASRYCLSDLLADAAVNIFGETPLGWPRVQAICDWVHDNVRFDYAAGRPDLTSVDVFERRVGVCRDFAHLAIAFSRALNIPARYVFGYLPDIGVAPKPHPMDFYGWMEVYLGGRWWTFDPRNNERRVGRVVIARGRDAMDVAMVTSFGPLVLEGMTVWADEIRPAATGPLLLEGQLS